VQGGAAALHEGSLPACYDVVMRRTTVMLPEHLCILVENERKARDISIAAVIREAVERYFTEPPQPRRLGFVALGEGSSTDSAARMEEILGEEWGNPNFDRDPEFQTAHAGAEDDDSVPGSA